MSMCPDISFSTLTPWIAYLLYAVGAETLVEEVNVDPLCPGSGEHAGEAQQES